MKDNIRPDDTGGIKGQAYESVTLNGDDVTKSRSIENKLATGYRVYWEYLEWLGLSGDPNLIILSPSQHYYYDYEDMKDVTTILNLKQLNYIRDLKEFLKTVNHILSDDTFFIGSFIDRKHQFSFFSGQVYADQNSRGIDPVENGISSRIPLLNLIYDFLDSRTNNKNMTQKSVTLLLKDAGFRVIDMTEINGLTCFCAQKSLSR
ncbi:MAG TPA: hypothetical protein VK213_13820 [Bacteroidales bacterium]|nr:hypothetical protein [Bacteroidales bacterium]